MESMTESTPTSNALDLIAHSVAEHQPVRRAGSPFPACANPRCQDLPFTGIRAQYAHQAAALVEDLRHELESALAEARETARAEGRSLTAEEDASIRARFLVLAPAPAPERSRPGNDPRLAPAVEAFRQALARRGALSSISYVEDAMAEALAAADHAA
jgi:hypothetical protein